MAGEVQAAALRTGAASSKSEVERARAQALMPRGQADLSYYDGALLGGGERVFKPHTPLTLVPPLPPPSGNAKGAAIFVNGVNYNLDHQFEAMTWIAEKSGMGVVGLHNATDGSPARDVLQAVGDKVRDVFSYATCFEAADPCLFRGPRQPGKRDNPFKGALHRVAPTRDGNKATESLARLLVEALKGGEPVHLMAGSQGARVTSNAILEAAYQLSRTGKSADEIRKLIGRIRVETFGGAAQSWPDGPQYVHYINERDDVAVRFGAAAGWLGGGVHAGDGAVIHRFRDPPGESDRFFDVAGHRLNTYLEHRVPFEQALKNAQERKEGWSVWRR